MDNHSAQARVEYSESEVISENIYAVQKSASIEITKPTNETTTIDKVINWIIAGLVFIVPWIFSPFTNEYYEITKNTLLILGVSALLVLWAIKLYQQKQIKLFRSRFDLALGLLLVSYALSTFFSIYSQTSIWGFTSRMTGGLLSITFLGLFFYIIVNSVRNFKQVNFLLNTVLISITGLALFTIFNSFGLFNLIFENLAESTPSLTFITNALFTPIGNPNTVFALFILVLPIFIFQIFNRVSKTTKTLSTLASIILLIALSITSVSSIEVISYFSWLLIAAILLMPIIINKQLPEKALAYYVPVILIAIGSAVLALVPSVRGSVYENINFTQFLNPPFATSWQIITGTYSEYGVKGFLIGTGADTYAYDYINFKPIEQNSQPNWTDYYTRPATQVEALLVNQGLLGIASYSLFAIVSGLFLYKKLLRSGVNNNSLISLGVAVVTFFLLGFVSYFSLTILLVFFVLLALLTVSWQLANPEEAEKFNLTLKVNKEDQELNLMPYLLMSIFAVTALFSFYYVLQNYRSELLYRKAVIAGAFEDYAQADAAITKALQLTPNKDYFYRNIAALGLNALRNEAAAATQYKDENPDAELPQESQAYQQYLLEDVVVASVNTALELNPYDATNWENAALIFRQLVELTNGEQFGGDTLQAAQQAIALNPYNPDNYLLLGYVYQYNQDEQLKQQAEQVLLRAYELQPSYPLSIFALGNYLVSNNNPEAALQLYQSSIEQYYTDESEVNTLLMERIEAIKQQKLEGSTELDNSDIEEQLEENLLENPSSDEIYQDESSIEAGSEDDSQAASDTTPTPVVAPTN